MTVVYDLLGFQNRDHGERGIARYVLNLALALERNHPEFVDQYLVHPNMPLPSGIEPLLQSGKVTRSDRHQETRRPSGGGTFISGSLVELQEPLDVVLPTWARNPSWRTAAVLYDLIPLRFEDWYLSDPGVRYAYKTRVQALASLDHLLSISQASADDAAELLGVSPSKVAVIWAGADEQFRPPTVSHRVVAQGLNEDFPQLRPGYVMFPTGIERRKNIDRLLEAYAQLDREERAAHQLVLVCRVNDDERSALGSHAARLGISDDFLITGYVSDRLLVSLYQGTDLVVFPSLYEGFGLPALEAMRCGAPVICSDSSSLREVQRDPAFRFDPEDTESITDAMRRHLDDVDWPVSQMREQPVPEFSWEQAAHITVKALTEEPRRIATRPTKPRLGLVTPLPPQRSGIATYAARLLEHLQEHFDITVFVDPDSGEVEPIAGVRIEALADLPRVVTGGGAFDHLLYFMGNSTFHVEALEMLKQHPGWVLFHDARLTGLYGEVHRLCPERLVGRTVGGTLAAYYPWRYRAAIEALDVIPPDTADRFGILLTREVTQLAERCLVHSEYAANLIELDSGVRPLIPFAIPAPASDPSSAAPEPATISSFGIVAPVKCPELLIDALRLVRQTVPDARLRFVGGIDRPYEEHLAAIADKAGLAESVQFTGHVTDEEFEQAQRETTVAVQLRAFTNGESSAAVAEALAMGLPTITSDVGSMSEIPRGVVEHFDHSGGVESLAARLSELLRSGSTRNELSERALDYAQTQSFEKAAEVLARLLSES